MMLGMNPDAAEGLALQLSRSADQLNDVRHQVSVALRATNWIGVDAEQFDDKWSGELSSYLGQTSTSLLDLSQRLRTQIEQQLTASDMYAASGGGFWESLWNGVTGFFGAVYDGVFWLGEQIWSGISFVNDRIEEGINWAVDTWNASVDFISGVAAAAWQEAKRNIGYLATATAILWETTWDRIHASVVGRLRYFEALWTLYETLWWMPTGTVPPGRLAAAIALVAGTTMGVAANDVLGYDAQLFAQGTPVAGESQPVSVSPPQQVGDLASLAAQAYDHGGVLITEVPQPDGSISYIISISGTQPPLDSLEGWRGHPSGLDWPGNAWTMATGDSVATEAVLMAMANHGIPPGASVLFNGHSQGGLTGVTLAANPQVFSQYNVEGVVTFGSPVDAAGVPSSIPVLSFENQGDLVPILDFDSNPFWHGQGPSNVEHVTLGGMEHDQNIYVSQMTGWQPDPAAQALLDQMGIDSYLTGEASSYGVQIGQEF